MATTDLKLDEPGTLPRPGPIGRLTRLVFGALSIWFVIELLGIRTDLLDNDGHVRAFVWNGFLPSIFLISYVINIGFSRAWKKWPAIVSALVLVAIAGISYFAGGQLESAALAWALWVWELYIFGHLGVSFLISGLLATPGCEMRAFHDLYARITGKPTKEHYCPIGPLHPIDQWEAKLRKNRRP